MTTAGGGVDQCWIWRRARGPNGAGGRAGLLCLLRMAVTAADVTINPTSVMINKGASTSATFMVSAVADGHGGVRRDG